MVGLQRTVNRNKFQRKCEAVARKIDTDVDFDIDSRDDNAFEDDGCLHVRRNGLRAMFSIGQDTPGVEANEKIRSILSSLGMKRKIGKHTLVEEECDDCDGEGYVTCSEHGEHTCGNCDGSGLVEPEDYK